MRDDAIRCDTMRQMRYDTMVQYDTTRCGAIRYDTHITVFLAATLVAAACSAWALSHPVAFVSVMFHQRTRSLLRTRCCRFATAFLTASSSCCCSESGTPVVVEVVEVAGTTVVAVVRRLPPPAPPPEAPCFGDCGWRTRARAREPPGLCRPTGTHANEPPIQSDNSSTPHTRMHTYIRERSNNPTYVNTQCAHTDRRAEDDDDYLCGWSREGPALDVPTLSLHESGPAAIRQGRRRCGCASQTTIAWPRRRPRSPGAPRRTA